MFFAFLESLIPIAEISIIAVMVYYLLAFFWNTRAMDLAFGFIAFLLIFSIASWLRFPVLTKFMIHIANVAVFAILIIFQPELRLALARLSVKKRKKYQIIDEFDSFVEQLTSSVYRLSEKKIGALIVLENQDSLEDYINKSLQLNALFSSELIESIFMTTTPLHDGAVIIRETIVMSAATILPLAEDTYQISKSIGTRHRAGLGMSQTCDALVIVVSEESGQVSIAREGIITRGVKQDRFKGIIRSVFSNTKIKPKPKITFLDWFKR